MDEQIDLFLMIQLIIKFLPQIGIDTLQAHLVAAVALQKHRIHGFQPGVLPRSVPQDARRQKLEVYGQAGGLKAFFLKGAVIGIADDLLDRLDEFYGIVGQCAVCRTGYQMQGNVARFVLRDVYKRQAVMSRPATGKRNSSQGCAARSSVCLLYTSEQPGGVGLGRYARAVAPHGVKAAGAKVVGNDAAAQGIGLVGEHRALDALGFQRCV